MAEDKNQNQTSTVEKKSTEKDFEKREEARTSDIAKQIQEAAKHQGDARKEEIAKEKEALKAQMKRLEDEEKNLGSGDQKRLKEAVRQMTEDNITGHERENTPGTREHRTAYGS